MKVTLFISFILLGLCVFAQKPAPLYPPIIELSNESLGQSFTDKVLYLEDNNDSLSVADIIKNKSLPFQKGRHKVEHFDFTSSTYWVKFSVKNNSDFNDFVSLISRTITDEVILYEIENDTIIKTHLSGDAFTTKERTPKMIENLFFFSIPQGQIKSFIVKLKSDGENIRLPIIIDTPTNYFMSIRMRSFFLGVFYGGVLLIALLYLFYYKGLRDKSLLYYSVYLLAVFMLQFTLDGFTFYYLLSDKLHFLEPYSVTVFAGLAPFSFLIYVKNYLSLKKTHPSLFNIYTLSEKILLVVILLTFIPGTIHALAYPLVNITSLFALLLVLFSLFYIGKKDKKQYFFFSAAVFFLITGAILFILTNTMVIENEFLFKYALKIGTAIEVLFLTLAMSEKLYELQKEKEKAQALALASLKEKNSLIEHQKELLEKQVRERTVELEQQKEKLAVKNKEIIDSINYAKRLQDAIIPPINKVKSILPDSFVLFKPKDIVSGDFYWITEVKTNRKNQPRETRLIVTAADCTGHGVPGAFISIIGLNIFNQALKEPEVNNPAETLNYLNKQIYKTVNKHRKGSDVIRDGMDLAMCSIDPKTKILEFSGAKNPIYIIRDKQLIELKGDKQPIGFSEDTTLFTLQTFQLKKGDMLYLSTDGFADQFGGERGKKLKYKPFKEMLISISILDIDTQKKKLEDFFTNWKGNLEQLDDVCVVGVRI